MNRKIISKKKIGSNSGEYKIVTFVSLSSKVNAANILSELIKDHEIDFNDFCKHGMYYKHKKSKTNYLLFEDSKLNDHDLLFACRSSDALIFLVSEQDFLEEKLKIIKRRLPSYLVCVIDNKEKNWAKKFTKFHFGSGKIIHYSQVFEALSVLKIENTRVCQRPYFIPNSYIEKENEILLRGYLKKGFISKDLICNGKHKFEIISVATKDNEYDGNFFKKNDFDITKFIRKEKIEQKIENLIDEESSCSDHSSIEDDENSSIEEEIEESDLIRENQDQNNNPPDYFSTLTFFNRFNDLERRIINSKSILGENIEITLRLKKCFNYSFDKSFLVFFNVYPFEDLKTIYNVQFSASDEITQNLGINIDLGHQIVTVKPMLSSGNNNTSFITKEKMKNGVMTFIAPLTFNLQKIDLYASGIPNISICNFLGVGSAVNYNDRILLEEKIIKGYPQKLSKRNCTVHQMFHSKKEVMYFRNVKIKTKDGNEGIIKKPIGTHGRYKAYFNRPIQHGFTVLMSLCKRVYPSDYE